MKSLKQCESVLSGECPYVFDLSRSSASMSQDAAPWLVWANPVSPVQSIAILACRSPGDTSLLIQTDQGARLTP